MSLHLSPSTLYIAISKCLASWYQRFYIDLSWPTQTACAKVIYICNFRCPMKEKTKLLLSWSTLHIAVSKCVVSCFHLIYFDFPLFTQHASIKVIYSWNFRWSVKGVVISLVSWSTLYKVLALSPVWEAVARRCSVWICFSRNPPLAVSEYLGIPVLLNKAF